MYDEYYSHELELFNKKKREKTGLVVLNQNHRNKNENKKSSKAKSNGNINKSKSSSVVVYVLNETRDRTECSKKSLGNKALKKIILHGNFISKLKEAIKKGKKNKKVPDESFTPAYSLSEKDDYTACPTSISTKKHSNCFYRMKL